MRYKPRFPDKTMKRIILSLIICTFIFSAVYAQEETPVSSPTAPETITPLEIPADIAADKSMSEEKTVTPKANQPQKTAQATTARETKGTNTEEVKETTGLLPLTEGEFKYERIPGISVKKSNPAPDELNIADPSAGKTGGFSALNSDLKNNLIRGGIVLLIFILFIFYRSRSGKRRRRY